MMLKRNVSVVVVVVLLVALLAGCAGGGGSKTSGGGDGEGYKFGATVSMITGYYSAMISAIESKTAELGIELVLLVADSDTTKQNQQMENLIAQKVDAIVCNPEDGTAIAAAVTKAMDAGIPVVTADREVEGAMASKQVIGDSYGLSRDLMEWFVSSDEAKNLGRPAKILVMVGSMADSYAVNCLAAHREVIQENPDVFELVAEIPGDWNQDTALKGIQNALSSNPDIDLIVTPSDMYLPPINSALTQINRWKTRGEDGHVYILSTDGDAYGMQMVRDGYVLAEGVVDARACGEWSVEYALKILKGEEKADGEIARFPCFVVPYYDFDKLAPTVYSFDEMEPAK